MNASIGILFVAGVLAAACLSGTVSGQSLVAIDTVVVGDAGNPHDVTGYGGVSYPFATGRYEVSLSQYAAFLNAVAAADPHNLYNPALGTNLNVAGISRNGSSGSYTYAVMGSGSRPVSYVSWFDAARFANWMHNGGTNGASTETGAYTLNGATTGVITRNIGATWWIPSEHEWYKAAYYDPSPTGPGDDDYWLYPTRSDTPPGNQVGAVGNQANLNNGNYSLTQSPFPDANQNFLTDGGVYSNSASFYGTYDQGGNVFEWHDGVSGSSRGNRGGSWAVSSIFLSAANGTSMSPGAEWQDVGFRVATVPEPSPAAMGLAGGVGLLAWRLVRAARRRSGGTRSRNPAMPRSPGCSVVSRHQAGLASVAYTRQCSR